MNGGSLTGNGPAFFEASVLSVVDSVELAAIVAGVAEVGPTPFAISEGLDSGGTEGATDGSWSAIIIVGGESDRAF